MKEWKGFSYAISYEKICYVIHPRDNFSNVDSFLVQYFINKIFLLQGEYCLNKTRNGKVDRRNAIEVIIVGAGVAGSALAYTLGKEGRRVRVIERDLNQPDRIVGELLQLGGYLKLLELGFQGMQEPILVTLLSPSPMFFIPFLTLFLTADSVHEIDAQRVFSYVLYKNRKNTRLSYTLKHFQSDVAGMSFHNGRFIQRMRHKAASLPNIEQGTMTSLIEENGTIKGVQYKTKGGRESSAYICSPYYIVCDDCFSNLRYSLCDLKVNVASYFVSLALENCKLLLVSKAVSKQILLCLMSKPRDLEKKQKQNLP
ncbi:hypothetical protein ES319_D01G206100v1 [Gossypium barbadense]|uniref:Squalene monooxygenase n=1 Tax=Gossypium barbadense TaxID=3634 RepID=A0A5J5SR23_GOSBA|nr:hypothetical protein ES319_D01G206100v1 [Gossypium barbadense]